MKSFSKTTKLIIIMAIIILGYLFALNGRYIVIGDCEYLLDKWNAAKMCIYPDSCIKMR